MTLEQLKAEAYDCVSRITFLQRRLQQLEAQMQEIAKTPIVEEPIKEDKTEE